MAKPVAKKRGTKKVRNKRRNGAPSGRDTITKGNFCTEAMLRGFRDMGFKRFGKISIETLEQIENIAYGPARYDYAACNKALVPNPVGRAIFDAAYAEIKETYAD